MMGNKMVTKATMFWVVCYIMVDKRDGFHAHSGTGEYWFGWCHLAETLASQAVRPAGESVLSQRTACLAWHQAL